MIPVTSQRVIEVIRDEICNPDLNVAFLCIKLSKSRPTICKSILDDFNVNPSTLIQNIKLQRILKNTYDWQVDIYESARYYGITRTDSFYKLIKRNFNKTPTEIEYELVNHEDKKKHFLNYHKSLMIQGLII